MASIFLANLDADAIGLGATWDVDLINEVSRITATEARVLEHLYWERSAVLYATSFDGG